MPEKKPHPTLDFAAIPWEARVAEWRRITREWRDRLPFFELHRGIPLRVKGFFGKGVFE